MGQKFSKNTNYSIYGQAFFDHNSTIIYRLLVRNQLDQKVGPRRGSFWASGPPVISESCSQSFWPWNPLLNNAGKSKYRRVQQDMVPLENILSNQFINNITYRNSKLLYYTQIHLIYFVLFYSRSTVLSKRCL